MVNEVLRSGPSARLDKPFSRRIGAHTEPFRPGAGFRPMNRLRIEHVTRYTYAQPVTFGTQRMLIRPRDSHALRLIDARLSLSQPGQVRWRYDALGNCVCAYAPAGEARELVITSEVVVERYPTELNPAIDDPHSAFPVAYEPNDHLVLEPMLRPVCQDPEGVIVAWLRTHLGRPGEPALDVVQRINAAIHFGFDYRARYEEGVQGPVTTLEHRSGTCRDFAWLMVESLRRLGLAARFVTGYIHSSAAVRGAGETHAWCEAFLPRLGWLEFDPTNGLAESSQLIPVAIARTPAEALPISGAYFGPEGVSSLSVSVRVTEDSAAPEREAA